MLLEINNVNMYYGAFHALRGISFSLAERESLAVIGPNGAGKTTLFKAMTGESIPSSGSVTFLGEDVTRIPGYERTRKGMARTFQVAKVFEDLEVVTNIVVAVESRRRGLGQRSGGFFRLAPPPDTLEEARALAAELGLSDVLRTRAKILSYGDKKRLELAMALALRPKILMLDEPTAGMAPADRIATVSLIERLRRENSLAIIITEHDMNTVFKLAHRILVMNFGEVVALGTVDEVRSNPLVREIYLGKEAEIA